MTEIASTAAGGRPSDHPRKVPSLRRGDLVGIAAPASPVPPAELRAALGRFKQLGLRVVYREDLFDRHLYLARRDEVRAEELAGLFMNPEVRAIFCACPGYGSLRLLPFLPWAEIREHPKVFMGFSDITVLLAAIHDRCDFVTFHGPTVVDGFKKGSLSELTWRAFRRVLVQGEAPLEFRVPRARVLGRGTAVGRLVGGNLDMVTSLLGTPWELDTRGAILFLEEIGEGEETLDQRLTQLRLSGKLDGVKAIVFGDVQGNELSPPYRFETVVKNALGVVPFPILIGFPAGHGRHNMPLAIGARYSVCAEKKTVTQLEAGVEV